MSTVAVIPAAGAGSRLGMGPKLLVEVTPGRTIWSVLRDTLLPIVDEIVLVVSPSMRLSVAALVASDPHSARIHIAVQQSPVGMGDAVFSGYECWQRADRIVVVWGDQVFVSEWTIRNAVAHQIQTKARVVIPVVRVDTPYVEYRFDDSGLVQILQTREGDVCEPAGLGDVGTFVLSTAGLREAWDSYVGGALAGAMTGEVNFLPFFIYLSENGWPVIPIEISDQREARGVNTPEDLALVRDYLLER